MARLNETAIAFARLYPCGSETAIAFAGAKWVFLVQFLGAEVMPVSAVPCRGRAVVLLVSTSPCFCVLCAKFVALHGLMWVRARKSSPCAGLGYSAAHEVGCSGGFAALGAGWRRVAGVSMF